MEFYDLDVDWDQCYKDHFGESPSFILAKKKQSKAEFEKFYSENKPPPAKIPNYLMYKVNTFDASKFKQKKSKSKSTTDHQKINEIREAETLTAKKKVFDIFQLDLNFEQCYLNHFGYPLSKSKMLISGKFHLNTQRKPCKIPEHLMKKVRKYEASKLIEKKSKKQPTDKEVSENKAPTAYENVDPTAVERNTIKSKSVVMHTETNHKNQIDTTCNFDSDKSSPKHAELNAFQRTFIIVTCDEVTQVTKKATVRKSKSKPIVRVVSFKNNNSLDEIENKRKERNMKCRLRKKANKLRNNEN